MARGIEGVGGGRERAHEIRDQVAFVLFVEGAGLATLDEGELNTSEGHSGAMEDNPCAAICNSDQPYSNNPPQSLKKQSPSLVSSVHCAAPHAPGLGVDISSDCAATGSEEADERRLHPMSQS
jgi:hypothetical protein